MMVLDGISPTTGPQWSPPVTRGETSHRRAGGRHHSGASMEPPCYQRGNQSPECLVPRDQRASMEPPCYQRGNKPIRDDVADG